MQALVVGIDAACYPVLDPLFEADAIPTLERLFEGGASGPLESQIPPWTASAWPSLYSGKNPGKHGIYDFVTFEGYDWRVVSAADLREPPLWQLLDENGVSSVVVNAPVTAPVRPFDGALVPGYMAPEDPTCHPDGLRSEIRDAIGPYRVYPEHTGETVSRTEARAEYLALTAMRGEAFRYLADRFDPEFGFVQFQQTDTLFHEFPDDPALVRDVYAAVDSEVEEILSACDPDTVFVVSDHGMGPYDGHEVRTNEILRMEGYVSTTTEGTGMPTWSTVRDGRLTARADDEESGTGAVERIMAGLSAVGLTSQRIGRACERLGIDGVVRELAPARAVRAGSERVAFASSEAYVRSRIELGVRMNVAGRDPEGTVPQRRYEEVRSSLIDLLAGLETPDGRPAFEEVAPREAYFHGPAAEEAVDIVTVPHEFDQFLSATVGTEPFGEPSEPWNHKREGVIAAAGNRVDTDGDFGSPHLFDVAPTVMAAMGVPYDERMDGRPLPFVPSHGERRYPTRKETAGDTVSDSVVQERLADLGYLE
ncbi:type I phosphodiesterase/nucleotide pyrophosphatase [Halosimplex carlsbadense 2-9-1]|uniref:Type I phosphodiesterase/nucleotide pyrophosphatase n=1 Tax=Halosimplex carlsbadense 2-9-1 TaxID=797114 RepID=M0CPA9_9EURY|nr:alkaline phosphatase family protein [Halosimplex carlsbadense]ELZ23714.1 type I phosphodiesterase/nucleotide pyrophosphatase [Halosimplex carlsbadense 2-9-1]